ncbi:zinc finger, CCHC-type containing protein [Tanacetum coccineum]
MGDENHIHTLGEYSKPSHEGYRNTSELPEGNNVVPIRSDTIYDNRERTRLCLFQFSLCDQASNWLERLPVGSILTWEDPTTRFLAQFFLLGRTTKLRNDILIFQQHQGEFLSEAWTRFKDLLQKVPHHGIDLWLQVQIFYEQNNLGDTYNPSWKSHPNLSLIDAIMICPEQPNKSSDNKSEEEEQEEKDNLENINTNPSSPHDPSVLFVTKKVWYDGDVMFIEIIKKNDDSRKEEPKVGENAGARELEVEYFDIFLTRRNFTYVIDFMIFEDISLIIDPRLSQVVLGKPFVEISNMTHDPPEEVVRFTDGTDEIDEEDKKRGVEYVMSKILGFYKECLKLGPEYLTGIADEGEVT